MNKKMTVWKFVNGLFPTLYPLLVHVSALFFRSFLSLRRSGWNFSPMCDLHLVLLAFWPCLFFLSGLLFFFSLSLQFFSVFGKWATLWNEEKPYVSTRNSLGVILQSMAVWTKKYVISPSSYGTDPNEAELNSSQSFCPVCAALNKAWR